MSSVVSNDALAMRSDMAVGGILRPAIRFAPYMSRQALGRKIPKQARAYVNNQVANAAQAKFYDLPVDNGTPEFDAYDFVAGDGYPLFNIVQGDGNSQHMGDVVTLDRMRMYYRAVMEPSTPLGTMYNVRMVVFQWLVYDRADDVIPANRNLPTWSRVFEADIWNAAYKTDVADEFRVIYDKTFSMVAGTSTESIVDFWENGQWMADGIVRFNPASYAGTIKV
jgi:hypothetical protein